jgi:hypothetical protein
MRVVIPTSNNMRMMEVPPNELESFLCRHPRALVNPSLEKVKGVAPHHWQIKDGELVPMGHVKQSLVAKDHATRGVDNKLADVAPFKPTYKELTFSAYEYYKLDRGLWMLAGMALMWSILHFLHKI